MVVPPPPRFSTTTVCPASRPICSNTARATMSVALPAVNGTMILIGLAGQTCAAAGTIVPTEAATSMASPGTQLRRRIIIPSSIPPACDCSHPPSLCAPWTICIDRHRTTGGTLTRLRCCRLLAAYRHRDRSILARAQPIDLPAGRLIARRHRLREQAAGLGPDRHLCRLAGGVAHQHVGVDLLRFAGNGIGYGTRRSVLDLERVLQRQRAAEELHADVFLLALRLGDCHPCLGDERQLHALAVRR